MNELLQLRAPGPSAGNGLVQPHAPEVRFRFLDSLWIQVTGTRCNIACRHCFVSCGPKADHVPMMSPEQVERALDEGRALGMRQVYFTGGEPFLHTELKRITRAALRIAPLTIVTNGLLVDDAWVDFVRVESERSRYSLDLRISLDGTTAEENDRVRGHGTFDRVIATLRRLGQAGLSPTVAVVEHERALSGIAARLRFLRFVRNLGIPKARVKFQPLFRIGREIRRTHGYPDEDVLHSVALLPEVESSLMCASGRAVTSQGVYTCPMLIEHASARLGSRLAEGAHSIRLHWDPCQTCVFDGLRCQN